LCDLPYGTTACKWDQVIPFEPLWREYWRVCKPNAAVVLTASQPFTSALIMSQINRFRCEWIWRKNAGSNFVQTKRYPMKEHENICVFSNESAPKYNPIMQERSETGKARVKTSIKSNSKGKSEPLGVVGIVEKIQSEMRVPSSVQDFKRERGLHPTQKPVALFDYLIRTYTNPGDLVLDNCAGSGTTAVAAQASDRRWICIERDLTYYLGAVARVMAAV
jgi:site-specific DNA-methyltransferase (adenine-specific)